MTECGAIKELHEIRPSGGIIPQKRAEAIDVAINALEKQIPKQIDISKGESKKHYYCPVCYKWLTKMTNYCCKCGQKLDLSEEE